MTDDDARSFLRAWWESVWRDGDVEVVDALVAETYRHHSAAGNVTLSRAELKRRLIQYQRVLHGAVTTVDAYALHGDTLWHRATSRGVNLETGAPALVSWMVVHRFEGGRLVEGWAAAVPDVDWTA